MLAALLIRRAGRCQLCRVGTLPTPDGSEDLDVTRVRATPAFPAGLAVQVTDPGLMTVEWREPVAFAAALDAAHPRIAAAIRAALDLPWAPY